MADEYIPKPHLKIWLDGKFVPVSEAKVSVYDHGLLYGDGVFEGIRVYNGRIFECDAHMERLYRSAAAIRLNIPYTREQLVKAMEESIVINKVRDGYIRLCVTRGVGTLGIHPFRTVGASVFIITDAIAMYEAKMYEEGMHIVTAATLRNHPAALSPQIKSLNYLNNIMAKIEAVDANCLEAVMLNPEGYIAECTGDNLFLVKHGVLKTPATHCGILIGITRDLILRLARKRGIPTEETTLTRTDLYMADEAFITGTGAEVCPVVSCDKRSIGDGKPGPITKQLMADFRQYAREGG
ncbi:MAG: branched-chain-amino-acid transaminase [Phycisphaerae bacterium]|nr:branched-chain-amino-acid transaminase [Phycisphaerae bacterium]NUQ45868.1 branched-chain-amino-acid transaminase [Phycisphaerae bacterium]